MIVLILVIVPIFAAMVYTTYVERQREFAKSERNINYIAKLIAIEEEMLSDETRQILVSLSHAAQTRDPRSAACSKFLSHIRVHYKRYVNFGVIDTSGNVVCSALPMSGRVNLSDRDFFREAMEKRDFAIGKYQIGRISKRPTVVCGYPVDDGKGRVRGVVFAAVDLDKFSILEKGIGINLPNGASMSKIDDVGTVLVQYPGEKGMTGKPFPKLRLIEPLMKRGSGLVVEKGEDGRKRLIAVASVPKVARENKIFVVVGIPEDVAFFEIDNTTRRNMTILAIIAVIVLGTAWFGSGFFILQPVHSLLAATNRVALGDLNGRAGPPYPEGELGELARNYDRMTNALAERQAERERAEASLRDSEERHRSIINNSPFGIYRSSLEGRFLVVNPALVDMLGYESAEDLMNVDLATDVYLHPEDRKGVLDKFMDRSRQFVLGVEVDWKRKDGKALHVRASGKRVLDESGALAYFEVFVEDVTKQRLLEKQLQTAQRMESVGTLAGGIAHDFNNALTGIIGYGELLRGKVAGDRNASQDLDAMMGAAERASTLTRQLLTYSRRLVIDPVNLSLNVLTTDLMKLIGKVAGEHMEIRTILADGLPTIRADRGQIEQVLMNLCLNARDAMPEGGRLLVETASVRLDEEYVEHNPYIEAGRYVSIKVSDTGIGMDEKTRERVFEPFFTTKGPDKGTGLGLSMVYGIVKQHGGFIHVYSELGKGTTFKVYFPAVEALPDAVVETRLEETVRGGTETILLAEDEEPVRNLAERALKELGYKVLVARNGEEAIDVFRQNGDIVLVVSDVIMPKKGGKEACEEMRKANPNLKVIFMSGYTANAIHDSFVLIAGVPFLPKPFSPSSLARKVREVLDKARDHEV